MQTLDFLHDNRSSVFLTDDRFSLSTNDAHFRTLAARSFHLRQTSPNI